MKKKLHNFYLKRELEAQKAKRPLTETEKEDIKDYKEIMRGSMFPQKSNYMMRT